jgi:hypothetical protein
MRCPVMQLSATVEGMDITDRQAAGTIPAMHRMVNDRQYILEPIGRRARAALAARPDGHEETSGDQGVHELPATGAAPAMVNAVSPAVGRRIRCLPICRGMAI